MAVELRLTWQQIECGKCAAHRHRAQPCDVCGTKPDAREVDDHVVRRKPAALRAAAQLARPVDPVAAPDRPAFEEFSGLIEAFFAAAGQVAAATSGAKVAESGLQEQVGRLQAMKALAAGAVRMRPWVESWRTFDRVLVALESLFALVLEAMQKSCQRDGVAVVPMIQVAINKASAELADLSDRLERVEKLAECGSEAGVATELLREATAGVGGDLLRLEEAGAAEFERRFGDVAPTGLGIGTLVTALQVDALFDPQRFWSVAREVSDAALSRLPAVARDPAWDATFGGVEEKVRLAVNTFTTLISAARRTEDELRAALTLAADLVEGPGRRLIATALAAQGVQTLSRLQSRDASVVLHIAQQRGLTPWLEGWDVGLRNGRFHDDYVIENDSVVLPNGKTWTTEMLLDGLLAGLESTAALHFGLVVAGCRGGIDIDQLASIQGLFPEPHDAAIALCTAWGWSDLDLLRHDETLRIVATPGSTPVRSATVASIAAMLRDSTLTRLVIETHEGDRTVCLEGPLGPHRTFATAEDELEKGANLMRIGRSWARDGEHLLTPDHVRKWAAMMIAPVLRGPSAERKHVVRCLEALAEDVDDPALLKHVRNVQGAVRAVQLALAPLPGEQEAIEFFAHWEQTKLEVPDI